MTTGNALLKVGEYVRINAGLNPVLLQAHRDAIRLVFSNVKPSPSNTSFHVLHCDDVPYPVPIVDSNIWVMSLTDTSSLTITEFNGDNGDNPTDTIGELGAAVLQQLIKMTCNQDQIKLELRLMNARIEEAFETGIDKDDML